MMIFDEMSKKNAIQMDLRRIADLRNKSYKQNISLRFDKSLKRRRDKSDFLPQLLNHSSKNANR